jgi:hypothetical protein
MHLAVGLVMVSNRLEMFKMMHLPARALDVGIGQPNRGG